MSERKYYCFCDSNCKFETMTKEQIFAAIAEATGNTPTGVDNAFVTKIKELRANAALQFWVGTKAQYNALTEKRSDVVYIVTDESDYDDIEHALEEHAAAINAHADLLDAHSRALSGESDVAVKGRFTGRLQNADGSSYVDFQEDGSIAFCIDGTERVWATVDGFSGWINSNYAVIKLLEVVQKATIPDAYISKIYSPNGRFRISFDEINNQMYFAIKASDGAYCTAAVIDKNGFRTVPFSEPVL